MKHVIQFWGTILLFCVSFQAEFATSAVDFLHRVGRTARAGQPGLVTSLYTKANHNLVTAIRQAGKQGQPVVILETSKINCILWIVRSQDYNFVLPCNTLFCGWNIVDFGKSLCHSNICILHDVVHLNYNFFLFWKVGHPSFSWVNFCQSHHRNCDSINFLNISKCCGMIAGECI